MAVLAAILPVVSRSSCLALELYQSAASSAWEAKNLVTVAKGINSFASILKQVGTIIKEDDRLPSYEALDVLENVIVQSQSVLKEFENATEIYRHGTSDDKDGMRSSEGRPRSNSFSVTRQSYVTAHLESLRLTLAVLLQTLYAAQSIMWSKLRPTVSPKQAAKAVANERIQLQALVVEQQMSILSAMMLHEQAPRQDARFLMEADSSQSLITTESESTLCSPSQLRRYQDTYLGSLDISESTEEGWLPAICSIAGPRTEHLLEKWTRLLEFDRRLHDAERTARTQKHETQQATVESDSEEDERLKYGPNGGGIASPPSQRSGSVQPLFMDTTTLPIPVPGSKPGTSAPLSPAASPNVSRTPFESPVSPHTSIGSLPVEAAAAVEAQEDEGLDLEIPWTLRTRRFDWRYIDSRLVGSNTDLPPSAAYSDRLSWTEIMASWVCKEAIQEAGYKVTQVQKERKDGRRTKFDTCFCIERPLQFDQIKHLVERTVELYRKNMPPTPPQVLPRMRRTSFDRPPLGPPPSYLAKMAAHDRDRTPTASRSQLPPERTSSTMGYPPPPPPPPLDRSTSMPGPGIFTPPPYPPSMSSQTSTRPLLVPMPGSIPAPNGQYSSLPPHMPYPLPPPNPPQYPYAPPGVAYNGYPIPSHMQPYVNPPNLQSPLRQSYLTPRPERYDDDSMTSDSGSGERRRRRSKSRRRHDKESKGERKKRGKSAAVGTLMGIGGLTALLDGL